MTNQYVSKDYIIKLIERIDEPSFCALATLKYGIKEAPPAGVVPAKYGKWTLNRDGSATCSECGRTQLNAWDYDNWDNFCRSCGADMREIFKK